MFYAEQFLLPSAWSIVLYLFCAVATGGREIRCYSSPSMGMNSVLFAVNNVGGLSTYGRMFQAGGIKNQQKNT